MQDKAIIEIGNLKGDRREKPYQNFIGNLFPGKNYDMILAVFNFCKKENELICEFDKVDVEKVSEKGNVFLKYAYRKGSARGGDITFTTKFGDIDKKFEIFYPKQVKDIIGFAEKSEEIEEVEIFSALKACLEKNGEEVKTKLQEQLENLDKKAQMSSGFSVKFEGLGQREYLGTFNTVQKLLNKVGTVGKSEKYKVVSEGQNELCSICQENKPVLHGFASPFKYSTVDKTGLVSGFFKQKNNWKNYPICSDCALDFELGQKWVAQNLSKYFYGKNYFIIPKITVGSNPALLKKALNTLEVLDYKEKDGERIASREDFLMRKIGLEEGEHNRFSLNLMFYEENQTTKAIKIKLFLEQIFPSRFRTLFVDVPKIVNANQAFKNAITEKKEKKNLEFSFRIFKDFFDKDFYDIIQTVFLGTPISEETLYSKIMREVRTNYNKSKTSDGFVEPTKWTVLKAMMMLSYLKELKIIPNHKFNIEMNEVNETGSSPPKKEPAFNAKKFDQFLAENSDFLDSNVKIGVFAVGVYIRFLLNLQYANMNKATPFEKKFKGYHLTATLIKELYIEAKHKISQFIKKGGFYTYSNLREQYINPYFILNEHKLTTLTDNQLSFYFVAGLECANQFKNTNSKEEEND